MLWIGKQLKRGVCITWVLGGEEMKVNPLLSFAGSDNPYTKPTTLLRVALAGVVALISVSMVWVLAAHFEATSTYVSKVSLASSGAQIVTTNDFPFGYYGLEWPEVENNEFSPRIYIDSGMKPEDISGVMDTAASGGVQVYQYIPPSAFSLPLAELRDEWVVPAMAYGSEVMAGFYPSEEPGVNELSALTDFLNLVHETDPLGRPVVAYLGYVSVSNIQQFVDTVDIDLLGAYPVYKGYPQGFMTGMMDSGRRVLWPEGKRFYAVPETFGPILEHPDGPLLLRNNVYQGVIGGAEGIIFYEDTGFDADQYPTIRAELDQLREEFVGAGNLGAVVLSPDPSQVVTHTVLAGPTDLIEMDMFEYTRWYERLQYHLEMYRGDVYLLAVNIADEPLTIEFHGLPNDAAQVDVLFEGRSLPLAAGVFQDAFDAYEVHVYKAEGELPPGLVLAVDHPTRGLISNTPVLTVSGSVTPTASILVNGVMASVTTSGDFSHTLTLSEGMQTVTVTTTSAMVTRTVTLDTIPPETAIVEVEGEDVPPFTFYWEGSDSGSGVAFYSYRIDNGEWSPWTGSEVKTYQGAEYKALNLVTGPHVFQVRARDRAMNIDPTPAGVAFQVTASELPVTPTIDGPSNGVVETSYILSATTTDPDNDSVAFRFFWDDGSDSGWTPLVPSGTSITATHSWAEGGRYYVRVQARDEHGLTVPWSATPFHIIDIEGVITRSLPFGYYGLEWPEVENNEFSPRIYIDSGMKPEDISGVMDTAASGGVQVYQYIPPSAFSLPLAELRDEWVVPAMAYGSEVMAGFYPSEEPGVNELSALTDFLNLVHETDPLGRPVVAYLGYVSVSNIQQFVDTVDIDLLGAYPVYKGYPQGFMTGMMDSGRRVLWPEGKRFYAVPETFGPILEHPDGPLLLRNNVYQGVIGGAEGIIFYEDTGFDADQYPTIRAELDQLREEFVGAGNLGAVVLSPDPSQVVTHTVLAGPTDLIEMDMFEYTRWYERLQYHLEMYRGDVYLLAVNIADEPLTIEFHGLPNDAAQVDVLFEGRNLPLTDGVLQDTFAPYETHIYKAFLEGQRLYLPIILKAART